MPQPSRLSGKGPLGDKGVIVAYKANNVVLIPKPDTAVTLPGFLLKDYKDPAVLYANQTVM